jgi:DNA-directed RNA polymerase-3 subunit RPC5
MRPQFHHIDAKMEQERSSRARDAAIGAPTAQARAIHMTVKSRVDGEDSTTDNMGERITAAQQEKWKVHRWVDEEEEEAWQFYGDNMFVGAEDRVDTTEELKEKYPVLESSLMNMEYMDTISAPNDFARLSRTRAQKKKGGKGKENGAEINLGSDSEDE